MILILIFLLIVNSLAGITVFLLAGIINLLNGIQKRGDGTRNKAQIILGSCFLGAFFIIVAAILILLFTPGLVVIRFM